MLELIIYILLLYSGFTFIFNSIYLKRRAKENQVHTWEKISILIPVRNEEKTIGLCLESLIKQTYADFEIIVIDDDSHDASWQIISRYARQNKQKIKIFKSKPLPQGWIGKNWACAQLAEKARGKWLLFTDADTIHKEESVKTAYMEAKTRAVSLISYLPHQITKSLIEKIVIPVINFAFYLLIPLFMMKIVKNHNAAIAIGTFILIKKKTYQRFDGHKGLKNHIVEDVHMARIVKKLGEDFDLIDGSDLFYTRFYSNARDIWHGFSKNTYGAFEYSIIPYIGTLLFAYFIYLHPFIILLLFGNLTLNNPFFIQVLIILVLRLLVCIKAGDNILIIIFHPLMIIFCLLFSINSLRKICFGLPMVWKEREYKISNNGNE